MISSTAAAMYSWRYIQSSDTYSTAMTAFETKIGTDKINWWKFANYILSYGLTSVYGFGAIFQLTAMFGVITKANAGIWDWFVYRVGQVMLLTYLTFMFLAYNNTLDTDDDYVTPRSYMENDITAFLTIMGFMTATMAFVQRPWRQFMQYDKEGNKLFAF